MPPFTILIACDSEYATDADFFPGLDSDTSCKVMAALLGLTTCALTTALFGYNATLPASPFRTQSDHDLHLHYPTITSMLYGQLAGPEMCSLDPTEGGAWVLFRADKDETGRLHIKDLAITNIESPFQTLTC